jgi:signal transduction histidine kinase
MYSYEITTDNSYAMLFNQLPFPTAVLNKEMVVQAVNQAFLERYRFNLDQVQGKHCYQVFYKRDKVCPRERCHFVPVRVNSTYVYLDGEPVATVGIHTDLRSWLAMEDEVAQARMQVVQSDKMAGLGRMAAGIAHELNNPLTGITVFTELVDGVSAHRSSGPA